MTAPLATYRVIRFAVPRDAHQQQVRPPLHAGDTFRGHALADVPRWIALVEAGRDVAYIRATAVEAV